MRIVRYGWLITLLAMMVFSSCECSKEPAPVTEQVFPERKVGFRVEKIKPSPRLASLTPSPRPEVEAEEPESDVLDYADIPSDFPEDVPIWQDAELSQVQDLANAAHNVIFRTESPVPEVNAYYHEKMMAAGWTITQEFERGEHAFTTFKKGDLQMNLTIAEDARTPGKQIISIMYEEVAPLPFDAF